MTFLSTLLAKCFGPARIWCLLSLPFLQVCQLCRECIAELLAVARTLGVQQCIYRFVGWSVPNVFAVELVPDDFESLASHRDAHPFAFLCFDVEVARQPTRLYVCKVRVIDRKADFADDRLKFVLEVHLLDAVLERAVVICLAEL